MVVRHAMYTKKEEKNDRNEQRHAVCSTYNANTPTVDDACKCDHSIPLRVRRLLCFASAIIMSTFVCETLFFSLFDLDGKRADGRTEERVFWLKEEEEEEKRQPLSECLYFNDDGFCPSEQTDTRHLCTQCTYMSSCLYVLCARRHTCNMDNFSRYSCRHLIGS